MSSGDMSQVGSLIELLDLSLTGTLRAFKSVHISRPVGSLSALRISRYTRIQEANRALTSTRVWA